MICINLNTQTEIVTYTTCLLNMAQTNRLEHKTVVTVDPFRPAAEQKGLMNRWQWVMASQLQPVY